MESLSVTIVIRWTESYMDRNKDEHQTSNSKQHFQVSQTHSHRDGEYGITLYNK